MKKYFVTRSVLVTVTEIVESESGSEEVKDAVDNQAKSLAGEISDLGLAKKFGDVSYTFPYETQVTEIR
jgi:hypothetical protein